MGNKRARSDTEGQPHEDAARKRMKPNRPHKKKQKKPVDMESLAAIKKRARAIERLLSRDNLKIPADKQNELERELAAHKQRIEEARRKKERSTMIKKYHMVRFFERKKAMRFVKQLERKVAQATDPDEVAQLKADLHVAQVDMDYARYFPFMEPYVSLYAAAAATDRDETNAAAHYLRTPRPPMWELIEKTREEGQAALEKLQNRWPQANARSDTPPRSPAKQAANKQHSARKGKKGAQEPGSKGSRSGSTKVEQKHSRKNKDEDGDGDSDDSSDSGGFFEED
ncbi:hypothetical protein MYCTH_2304003 [Thermothelomyces thermophilus ATCC 42464]|uniref:rRNA-processing protein EFG1 n=1 Tax=Thermothelomyces thermophilus (strain ATCC 42464 / BCRC 31852 / DSM 1799) TaxID=573729 RepID=G2QE46_THET4|nr:uncharacterized protein MYCTH_2304003 [Thermothelomyces thermophilus ATCC 42464]AEO57629.1 hypothetical protein MYCTH_2304003 [Thermothelomyces thermophilus ATCC 42464]